MVSGNHLDLSFITHVLTSDSNNRVVVKSSFVEDCEEVVIQTGFQH